MVARQLTILSTWFPPNVMGGAEVNAQLVAEYAAAHGWEVTVLTGSSVLPRGTKYTIRSVPSFRPRPSIIYEPWWAARRAKKIASLIPPGSIIHAFDVLSRSVAAALRDDGLTQPMVATIQDISPICGSIDGLLIDGSLCNGDTAANLMEHQKMQNFGPLGKLTRYLRYRTATVAPYRRDLLRKFQAITTISHFLKDYLSLRDATVIPDLLVPPKAACKLERTSAPHLLTVGRLGYDKGTDLLLEALVRLPAFLLTLVGGGNQEKWKAAAAELGVADRVTFVGQVPIDEVGSWYHATDVVVLASRSPEGSSRTLLEAMSCGKAVVGPNSAGPMELVTEGSTGRLFERGDSASLATAIERAYQERASLGPRAQAASQKYRPAVVGPQYLKLYESLLT